MAGIITGNVFPKFDTLHAHCAMTLNFVQTSCLDVYNQLKDTVELWQPEPQRGGQYDIWDAIEEEYLWATRTTPVKKYVDDIRWDFFGNPDNFLVSGCKVTAKSRSRSLSYYDYNTNYCNMWNVFQTVPEAKSLKVETSECAWIPEDPVAVCSKY